MNIKSLGFYLRPTKTRYQFFAGPDFEAIAIFIIAIGLIFMHI